MKRPSYTWKLRPIVKYGVVLALFGAGVGSSASIWKGARDCPALPAFGVAQWNVDRVDAYTDEPPIRAIRVSRDSFLVFPTRERWSTVVGDGPFDIVAPLLGFVYGKNSTYVGRLGDIELGEGSTVVDTSSGGGAAILNHGGTAIGEGAQADPASIAIGAGARAGNVQSSDRKSTR
jgi:hypothetical protein